MQIVITCLFGLEHYCVEDLENIGYSKAEMTVTDGQVLVDAGKESKVCFTYNGELYVVDDWRQ